MKKSRRALRVWLPAIALAAVMLWLGCEQKGDISPTGTNRQVLTFLDTVFVDPTVVSPSGSASVNALVLNESNEPAVNENVRFSVNRGVLGGNRADTTVQSDHTGWARATLTAPTDSGDILVRTELLSMSETRTNTVHVSAVPMGEGLLSLWVESDTLFADNGISQSHVYARLRNAAHNPIAGAQILFSTSIGSIASPVTTDSLSGTARTTLVSTTEIGVATVTAAHGSALDSLHVSFLQPAAASSIVVSVGRPTLSAGADSTTVTAYVFDADNRPISDNTVVFFTTTLGTLQNLTVRTSGGVALTLLHASPVTGTAIVTATTGGAIHGSASVLIVPGPSASIQMTSSADTLFADHSSESAITALVRDTYGNPVTEGSPVSFTAQGGTVTAASTTGPDGRAHAVFRAGLVVGSATVVAQQSTAQGNVNIYLRATIAASLTLSANPLQLAADGNSTSALRAAVLDDQGRPISDGTSVTFMSHLGMITAATSPLMIRDGGSEATRMTSWSKVLSGAEKLNGGRAVKSRFRGGHPAVPTSSLYTTTTENGYAYATLTSPTQIGVDTLMATVQSLTDSRTVTYVAGTAAVIHVVPGVSQLPADGVSSTPVECHVTDNFGNAESGGVAVSVSATLGQITPASGVTGADGVFTTTLHAARQPGVCGLVATTTGASGYGEVAFTVPDVSGVILSSNVPSLLADGISTATLTASAVDANGMPVQGAGVAWQANPGLGRIISSTTITDSTGRATALFLSGASRTDAVQNVVATIGTHFDTRAMHFLGVTLTAWTDTTQLPADGVSTTNANALVRETTRGFAVPNATVLFGADLGSIPQSAVTNSSGIASALFHSGTQEGDVTITAVYGDTLRTTTSLHLNGTVADTLLVTLGQDELLADGVSSTPVTAVVYNSSGQRVPNTPVTFTAVGAGSFDPPAATSDQNGQAVSIYRSVALEHDQQVDLTVAISRDNDVKQMMLRGVTLSVNASETTLPANGTSTTNITAHLRRASTLVAIPGATVTFGSSLGTIPASGVTDSSGIVTVVLTSSNTPGTATVISRFGNLLTDTTHVTFYASTPTTLTLTAVPTVIPANNVSTSTLTAVVTDQDGNPVADGTQIHFSIPPQSGSLETMRATHNGVAVNTLTSSNTPGPVRVTTWAEANPVARDSVTVIYTVGTPAAITLAAQRDTLAANGFAVDTMTAHVTDAVGHPLFNVDVHYTTTIGNIAASHVTDVNGDSRVTFSSSQTGTAQVTAFIGEITASHTVYLIPGPPNSISLDYNPGSVGVRGSGRNETLLITATVRDANNNPVLDGTPVHFNINNSPGGGDFLSTTGPVSTINGHATVSYSSGTVSGSTRIRAICNTVSAISTEILVYAGPPFLEDISNACETSHMSLAPNPCNMFGMDVVGDSVMLLALVGDRYNNPVTAGTAVYFTTSAGVITTATGYTDSLGFARVTLYSGHPLPSIDRWLNTLTDPNLGGVILCSATPTMPGVAKVMASSAGVNANGDSITVWATTNVIFNYSQPILEIRGATVNGDPNQRTLHIGENALITFAVYDADYWPLVAGSTLTFSANHGVIYPDHFTVGCPGDTSYTISFFNNLSVTDDDAASPVLINVDTRRGDAFAFTETFTLLARLPGP